MEIELIEDAKTKAAKEAKAGKEAKATKEALIIPQGEPQQINTTSAKVASAKAQGEHPSVQELTKFEEAPLITKQPTPITEQVPLDIANGLKFMLWHLRGESFWEEGDDFRVDVLRFHTCLTDILGLLEKLEWWFEQDIDDERKDDEEDRGGDEIIKDSIPQCLCCITRFLILSFFEITQSGESLSTYILLSLSIHNKKWINNIPPLPKYQSWIKENSSNGSFGYNNIFNMSTMPCGSTKLGRTVTLTAEDIQKKKNDAVILKTFGGNEATKKTKKNLLKQHYGKFKAEGLETLEMTFNRLQVIVVVLKLNFEDINQINEDDVEEMDIKWNMALLSMRADKGRRDNYRKGSKVKEQALKALMAIDRVGWDWSYMENDEEDHALVADEVAPTEFALMANTSAESKVFDNSLRSKDCKKNNDSLNSKITDLSGKLFDANNLIYHYKLALAQVKSILVEYKEREVKYYKKIKTLEFHNESNNECIEIPKKKLETLKEEKEGVDGKLAGLLKASKDLDNLIESQRSYKIKDGLGYSAVPPPPAQLYLSPKKDLSWTGLPECADDTVTDYSRPSPTVESTSRDDQNRNPSVYETVASPITRKPFIKFVKPKDSQSKSKTCKTESPKKPLVKYAEQYRKPIKKPNVRGNQRNWNNLKSHQLGPDLIMRNKTCFKCGDFNHLAYDCKKKGEKEFHT
nr:ribonuclease H-like domain-containing protein [Tanacetum cinerariifolium]GEX24576.1 ribonuclease H-like domain-containing protein [Tanacetum cinerariifolium]